MQGEALRAAEEEKSRIDALTSGPYLTARPTQRLYPPWYIT